MTKTDPPPFSSEHVEAQITYHLASPHKKLPALPLLQALQAYYAPDEHREALARVWRRLLHEEGHSTSAFVAWFQKATLLHYLGLAALVTTLSLLIGRGTYLLIKHRRSQASMAGISQ